MYIIKQVNLDHQLLFFKVASFISFFIFFLLSFLVSEHSSFHLHFRFTTLL